MSTDVTVPTESTVTPDPSTRALILPPPSIRSIVDKTASFVSKSPNPIQFEEKIKAREKSDSRFAFLNVDDAYHVYYLQRLNAFKNGQTDQAVNENSPAANANGEGQGDRMDEGDDDDDDDDVDRDNTKDKNKPKRPRDLEFLIQDVPTINPVDLDILKLTALFAARSGRKFTAELAAREHRNYQFDFLRPNHSLFNYFNKLVEQYTKILIPSKEFLSRLEQRSGTSSSSLSNSTGADLSSAKRTILTEASERVTYEKYESSVRQKRQDEEEKERVAFAEIDWQDFVVASTVEFTEGDEAGLTELPNPMSLNQVQGMTIAQKKMAALIMEGKDAAGDDQDEDEQDRAEFVTSDKEEVERQKEERQKPVEIKTVDSNAPMKIRKDYVPKVKRPVLPTQGFTTFNGQQVPVEDFANHVRIELLDPKWKEDKRLSEANRSASNLLPQGTDVSSSIRALAAHRPDIFGAGGGADEEFQKKQAELLAQSKKRELGVWDGHTATKDSITSRYQSGANLDEQIEALHRAKGLVMEDDPNQPKIGPAVPDFNSNPQEPLPVESEQPASFMGGATLSSGPRPALPPSAVPPPPLQQQQMFNQFQMPPPLPQGAAQAGFYPPPPPQAYGGGPLPTNLPQRPSVAAPGEGSTNPIIINNNNNNNNNVNTRPAEADFENGPNAKRARIEKREDGTYWPEQDWLQAHPDPINLKVQLPDYPSKPAWGCDGSSFTLEVPLTLLVSTIRDRIASKVGLPISKQKFSHNGKILANSQTLAGLNFEDGDEIIVSIKEKK